MQGLWKQLRVMDTVDGRHAVPPLCADYGIQVDGSGSTAP